MTGNRMSMVGSRSGSSRSDVDRCLQSPGVGGSQSVQHVTGERTGAGPRELSAPGGLCSRARPRGDSSRSLERYSWNKGKQDSEGDRCTHTGKQSAARGLERGREARWEGGRSAQGDPGGGEGAAAALPPEAPAPGPRGSRPRSPRPPPIRTPASSHLRSLGNHTAGGCSAGRRGAPTPGPGP